MPARRQLRRPTSKRSKLGTLLHPRRHHPGLLLGAVLLRSASISCPMLSPRSPPSPSCWRSTVTIVGRNYGSQTMVTILTFTVVLPIALGLMLSGDIYHVHPRPATSCRSCSSSRGCADHVRDVLFDGHIGAARRRASSPQRFNRALNTMSHGLVMLGPDGRVVVGQCRSRASDVAASRPTRCSGGRSMRC